jgi:hypothetical protein
MIARQSLGDAPKIPATSQRGTSPFKVKQYKEFKLVPKAQLIEQMLVGIFHGETTLGRIG